MSSAAFSHSEKTGRPFLYSLDERPPWFKTLLYGAQWALLFIPTITVSVGVVSAHLGFSVPEEAAFSGRILLISGGIMILQTFFGHRLPLLDGPSSALLLAVIALAPLGLPAIGGGMLAAGSLLALVGFLGLFRYLHRLFTGTVVGVITSLIALSLVPYIVPLLIGERPGHAVGEPRILLVSVVVMAAMIFFSYHLKGIYRSYSFLWSVLLGMVLLAGIGRFDMPEFAPEPWWRIPKPLFGPTPVFHPVALVTFVLAYLAVLANQVGSVYSIAEMVGKEHLEQKLDRSIAFTGLGGIASAWMPSLGTVSYAISPGVVFATRVASRFALTACGGIVLLVSFCGKLNALLAAVPLPVIASALFVTMGFQTMVGISIALPSNRPLSSREHYVVGVPLILGTGASLLPRAFLELLPLWIRVLAGNGLVVGIVSVLLLEHVVLRKSPEPPSEKTG